MIRMISLFAIAFALCFSAVAPRAAYAAGEGRVGQQKKVKPLARVKAAIERFRDKHAGKIIVGSGGVALAATVTGYVSNGVPLKVAAGAIALGALTNGVVHAGRWWEKNFRLNW
jgi:hypothetical protein